MAGEIEEPFGLSFRSDSLHSGSISFGRFEREDLSWERRSSFSHNRYLEEVEKYSKPGSVTEKKAYFEAHFKKRGMLSPSSFEGYSQVFGSVGHGQGDDNANEGSSSYEQSDEGVQGNVEYGEFGYENEEGQYDYANDGYQYVHFDESPGSSEYHGEREFMKCAIEGASVVSSQSCKEASLDDAGVEHLVEGVMPEEAHQADSECDELHLENGRQEIQVEEDAVHNGAHQNEPSRPNNQSPNSAVAGKDDKISHRQNLSPKVQVRAMTESKSVKPRLKSHIKGSQVRSNISNDKSKTANKNQSIRKGESPRRKVSEKQSPQAATPTGRSLIRTPKKQNADSGNSILTAGDRSEKGLRAKKLMEPQPTGAKKVESGGRQSTSRVKQTVSSTTPEARASAATFSFKSGERAEKRKEFYMKLEEKMHAKEAEMNQIQARTQEKTEAEIKQLRKSLNFKATPMPSFYHTPLPSGSDGNKVASSKPKPTKVQQKLTSPGSGAAFRSQLHPQSENDKVLIAGASSITTDLSASSGRTDCTTKELSEACEIPQTNRSSLADAVIKGGVTGKEREKVKAKDASFQKSRVSDNSRSSKDQMVHSKQKMSNRRNGSDMVRKSIKGVGMSGTSGISHRVVGVAS